MKNIALSIFLGGMVIGIGMYAAPSAYAEDLPDANLHNQLSVEINQQATSEVNESLSQNPVTTPKVATTEPTESTVPATTSASPLIINTGNNANVDAATSQSSNTSVSSDNQAAVNQGVKATANTGNNTANGNISFGGNAGTINTGDATVYSELVAAANNNTAAVSGNCPAIAGQGGTVVNTGSNLNYDAGSSNNCTTTISNGNGAAINQVVNANANTGGNEAEGNIAIGGGLAGAITTGNATVGSMVVTRANSNVVLVGGASQNGGPGNGANIYIVNTGSNAAITDRRQLNTDTRVTNNNTALIDQHANLIANTGNNSSNGNINLNGDAGVITTGNAAVITENEVKANQNQTMVQNNANGLSGDNQTDITNTGDDLDADISSETNNSTTVQNTNTADVDQGVMVRANTGNNTANGNIAFNGDAGVITTGDALVVTSLETEVNSNQTLISETAPASDSGTTTDIVNTGNNLDVDVSNEANTTTTVTNFNNANVNQNVNAVANTGHNTANHNIGQSSMTTGDVTITTELITNANNNYTFIVDSNVNGLELFTQFVEAFLGMDWEDLISSSAGQDSAGNSVAIVNTGDNATVLAEQVQNREVVVNNTNNAIVNQNVNVQANTGHNTCDANIGDCRITTGDATIWTQLVANLNNNFTFIGNVQLPTPETPEEPETPATPEQPEQPEETEQPQVLGESIERPQAVLAASTLPMTGGFNLALLGLALIGGGLSLRLKKTQA